MDVVLSLKRKETMTVRKMGKSREAKIDGMIRWLQEMGPILQEFARRKNIRVPIYLPYMFGPTQSHQEGEEQESEEEGSDKSGDEETAFEVDD